MHMSPVVPPTSTCLAGGLKLGCTHFSISRQLPSKVESSQQVLLLKIRDANPGVMLCHCFGFYVEVDIRSSGVLKEPP